MVDASLKNANILIVDDQEANIDVLEGLLEMQGYTSIKTTTDPRDVLHLFASFEPDLILLDLMMPHLSGFEVMEQLKSIVQANTYLPILVLTADATSEARQRALSNGASDFLTKPFDLIEVGLRIRNLLLTSYLMQQVQNQNQILEEKVKERTLELETTNIELNIAKEKAEATDRLKSSFINNISHEIRTPLNGILGFGQILTDPEIETEEKEEYLSMMNQSSERLINTVTNFMDISLLTSGNQTVFKKEIALNGIINEAISKFRITANEKNITLAFNPPAQVTEIKLLSDRELLTKIICQLIDNAVKFTKQGTVNVDYNINGETLLFTVKDTGIGIAAENIPRIFDSFMQENINNTRAYEGSGLGLPIAKGFIELLGGNIVVESEKGKGSKFSFSLPCVMNPVGKIQENETTKPKAATRKQTILIAEDDEINFFYINIVLKNDLIEVLHAVNGRVAVEICKENPGIDLVIMDLKMPEMDGFEATRLIKHFNANLPVIAITAYSSNEDKNMALYAGCDDFITKPFKKEFLISKLEQFGLTFS